MFHAAEYIVRQDEQFFSVCLYSDDDSTALPVEMNTWWWWMIAQKATAIRVCVCVISVQTAAIRLNLTGFVLSL